MGNTNQKEHQSELKAEVFSKEELSPAQQKLITKIKIKLSISLVLIIIILSLAYEYVETSMQYQP